MDTEVIPFPIPHRAAGRAACWASVLLAVVMGLRCSKPEGTSIPVDTRRECRNSVLFPGPKLMVSQISELRAKLEESETALAEAKATIERHDATGRRCDRALAELTEAKATIGALTATIDGFEAKILSFVGMSSDVAMCPECSKTFFQGGFHPASQKLWQHMGHGKGHRTIRHKMRWNTTGWNGPWVSG